MAAPATPASATDMDAAITAADRTTPDLRMATPFLAGRAPRWTDGRAALGKRRRNHELQVGITRSGEAPPVR